MICPPEWIPAPGQYLLAHAPGSDSPLAVPVFFSASAPNGFRSAPLLNSPWTPGTRLNFRGPLGHGFSLPAFARRTALIAFDESPGRLCGLISNSLEQQAEVVLVCNSPADDLPEAVEVQPLSALADVLSWAQYAAFDIARENLPGLMEKLRGPNQASTLKDAEILVRTPVPCGGFAECGVCSVVTTSGWKMACKEGPVFDLREI